MNRVVDVYLAQFGAAIMWLGTRWNLASLNSLIMQPYGQMLAHTHKKKKILGCKVPLVLYIYVFSDPIHNVCFLLSCMSVCYVCHL